MASSGDYFLLEDLVIEILSWLPVKSLLRFKCVCKYWYTLIKSPSFISHHYHHHHNHTRLLVHHFSLDTKDFAFALFPDETLAIRQNLDHLRMPTNLTDVIGPVNGLFLLHKNRWYGHTSHLALWNPATREFRTLPGFDSNLQRCFRASENYFGFGLDPLTNDYKVIWIRYFLNDKLDVPYDRPVVGVYTLGNDSWKHLDPDSASIPLLSAYSSVYLNGAHYWLSYDIDLNSTLSYDRDVNSTIVRFDMGNEVFRVIQAPPKSKWVCLSLHNDCIALISCKLVDSLPSVDVWVMEQEGCWTKHFSIGSLPDLSHPLGLWKNNELFLEARSSQLVLFNLNSRKIRNIGVKGFEHGLMVFKYKESLVSVNVGNRNLERFSLSDILRDFFT